MDAEELHDLARRAANVTGYRQLLVLGSQAVHGSLPGEDRPEITTHSEETGLALVTDLTGDAAPRTDLMIPTRTTRSCCCSPEIHGHVDLEALDERVDQLPDTVARAVKRAAHEIVTGLR